MARGEGERRQLVSCDLDGQICSQILEGCIGPERTGYGDGGRGWRGGCWYGRQSRREHSYGSETGRAENLGVSTPDHVCRDGRSRRLGTEYSAIGKGEG